MLKSYRKRFVLFNMLLVGVVLSIALIVQGIYLYRSSYAEMKNTMRLIVEPWDKFGGRMPWSEASQPPEPTAPPAAPDDFPPDEHAREYKNILTVFYHLQTGEFTILSRTLTLESGTVEAAVREIAGEAEGFGYLRTYGLFFYQETSANQCKIALADSSYLTARVLRSVLVLVAVYGVSMGLVLLISISLSKLAAKPMEDAMNQERRFVTNISHDLKTPITVIVANNSILRNSPSLSQTEQAQWFDSTEAAAKNMMTMIDEMLTLSSLENAKRTLEKVPVNLSAAAEKAALQMESLAYERSIHLDCRIIENVMVLGTVDYVERICNSLLENALKYEPDGGSVRISIEIERRHAVLSVCNFGREIDPEDLNHIFERFYRGDKARNIQTGHGLGLPILKEIALALGAEVSVHSAEDTGTRFTVRFPLSAQSKPQYSANGF